MPHSVVTIALSVTVWSQFAMQILTEDFDLDFEDFDPQCDLLNLRFP